MIRILCINRDQDTERWERFQAEAKRAFPSSNYRLERIAAVCPTFTLNQRSNARIGCLLSHRECLSQLLEQEDEFVIACEDDAVFEPNAATILENALKELERHDPEWEMLYLGCSPQGPLKKTSSHIAKISRAFTTHAIIYHARAAKKLLCSIPKDDREQISFTMKHKAIDAYYANFIHPKGHCYLTDPQIAHQRAGLSTIESKETSELKFHNAHFFKNSFGFFLSLTKFKLLKKPVLMIKTHLINPFTKRKHFQPNTLNGR